MVLRRANVSLFLLLSLVAAPNGQQSERTARATKGSRTPQALRRYFVGKHGAPAETYVTGHSMGGHITMAIIERYSDVYQVRCRCAARSARRSSSSTPASSTCWPRVSRNNAAIC